VAAVLAAGLDRGDPRVDRLGREARPTQPGDQRRVGPDVDVVTATAQLEEAGDQGEDVPGGGGGVGEKRGHGKSPSGRLTCPRSVAAAASLIHWGNPSPVPHGSARAT